MSSWTRKLKRREAGVYAYRTDRHMAPGREWGYVGESLWLAERDRQHRGYSTRYLVTAKAWMDLTPRRYILVRLPWWLAFSWVTRTLETLAILALRPRYNWKKNPRAGKVGPRGQQAQLMERKAIR